jgi:hypothetical protein
MSYDRTMIVIRERSFMDLMDLALLVVRAHPVTIGLAAFCGIAPFAALNYWLRTEYEIGGLWLLLLVMEVPWATAPLTLVLGDLMFGIRPRPWRIAKALVFSFPALVFTQIFFRGILLVLILTSPLVPAYYGFLDEVILLERARNLLVVNSKVIGRSRELCQAYGLEFVGRWLGQVAIGLLFAYCFAKGTETLVAAFIGEEPTWYNPRAINLGGALFQAGIWIAVAYFGVVRFLSYIDRRIRLEGWEIELRLKAVGRSLEERLA